MSASRLQQLSSAVAAVLGVEHAACRCASSSAGQREDVAHVVVDDQHLAPGQARSSGARLLQHAALRLAGSCACDAVQEQRRLVQQALRRAAASLATIASA